MINKMRFQKHAGVPSLIKSRTIRILQNTTIGRVFFASCEKQKRIEATVEYISRKLGVD